MRVLVAEDDTLLREGLAALLGSEGCAVVTMRDVQHLERALTEHRADVAILDVRLPPTFTDEGLRAAIEIRRRRPGFPVLVLSAHVEARYARELLADDAGAVGYLLKERVGAVAGFVDTLTRVTGGATIIDPEVISALMRRARNPLDALTRREREVLALVAQGDRNTEIAEQLHVTEAAVNKHIRNIFSKLGLEAEGSGHRRVLATLTYLREHAV